MLTIDGIVDLMKFRSKESHPLGLRGSLKLKVKGETFRWVCVITCLNLTTMSISVLCIFNWTLRHSTLAIPPRWFESSFQMKGAWDRRRTGNVLKHSSSKENKHISESYFMGFNFFIEVINSYEIKFTSCQRLNFNPYELLGRVAYFYLG